MYSGAIVMMVDACRVNLSHPASVGRPAGLYVWRHCSVTSSWVGIVGAWFVENVPAVLSLCVCVVAGVAPRVDVCTAFATGCGASARESLSPDVRNGYFTGALLRQLDAHGRSMGVRRLMERVKDAVVEVVASASGGVQVPEFRDGLRRDVFLLPSVRRRL